MCASPLRFLRAGPPPPKVALLPDVLFFTRSVAITPGASAAEAATQVELALEAMSPFPLAQLYYGWYWMAGAENALVFASYRRRFTSEQAAQWDGAEVVLPSFATVLGAEEVKPATTIVLESEAGLTAVHWETTPVPTKVLFRPLAPEASDDDRARVRDELLRGLPGSRTIVDLQAPLAADPARSDREIVFRSGEFTSRLPSATAAALDVRDKAELAALRNARQRDVILWRVALGSAAALLLLGLGELALVGGRAWQTVRVAQYNAQKPLVDKIEAIHELTQRIEDVATKRLMPLEMVTKIVGENLELKPEEITFTRVQADQTRGLYTLLVEGTTTNAAQVEAYGAALRQLPACEKVDANISGVRGTQANFTLTVTFKPDAFASAEAPKASTG